MLMDPFSLGKKSPLRQGRLPYPQALRPKNWDLQLRLSMLLGLLLPLALLVLVLVLAQTAGVSPDDLTRDPWAVFDEVSQAPGPPQVTPYVGILSTLGLMLWAGSAAVTGLGALYLGQIHRYRHHLLFLLYTGLLSLMLGFDDAFMLHEHIGPLVLGIPEKAIYLGYALALGGYMVVCRRQIFQVYGLLLMLACAFLATSMGVDSFFHRTAWQTFVEDSFKFIGIFWWFLYCVQGTLAIVQSNSQLHWQRQQQEQMKPRVALKSLR